MNAVWYKTLTPSHYATSHFSTGNRQGFPHRAVTFERLSTGLKQRLGLAKALINDPELLFTVRLHRLESLCHPLTAIWY